MTPEQEKLLQETHAAVGAIQTSIAQSQETLRHHTVAIDGTPGNGANPGLRTRVSLVEQWQQTTRKWFWFQVSSMFTCFVAVAIKWIVKG
jgi:hypothetical protein